LRYKPGVPRLSSQGRRWLVAERRWPSAGAEGWVKRFLERACKAPETVAVVLIGSLARATPEARDVDLLYVHEGDAGLLSHCPDDVDIRAYRKEEFMDGVAKRDDLVTWALRYGRVLCQRDLFWSELISSFGGHLPVTSR